ncbi:hypothetical protein ILP97_04905 [Amycolatopsis sp. H6(2020)]|nr:hypothetical protein [Amycolatopsis sp. H6(2020)]
MGDIARHRDIFLFTRDSVPADLLERSRLTVADLTYLELGNYLTDVSQFRDPVSYLFAKQRIWRDFIVPGVGDKALPYRVLAVLAAVAGVAANRYLKDLIPGVSPAVTEVGGAAVAAAGTILAAVPSELLAALAGADDWIDAMFGTPLERTPGDPKHREEKHYGYLGQFFRHLIEGVTHLLFAQDVKERAKGEWGRVDPVSESRVTEIFADFFTQYFPHEHTDQPPYVWDASRRPAQPAMYGPSRRQRSMRDPDVGVMNAVDVHYVQYLSEELTDLEQQWRALKPGDAAGRQRLLVRLGKLLHGIEDWYFHSNVAEILSARGHTPPQGPAETDEDFLRRFVGEVAGSRPEFVAAGATERRHLQRKLYRRLRFPAYESGTGAQSGGRLSTRVMSKPSLRHAYPAFPSQQDTAHTLLHAMENLEHKLTHAGRGRTAGDLLSQGLPEWVPRVVAKLVEARNGDGRRLLEEKAAARGVRVEEVAAALAAPGHQRALVQAVIVDVLREWVPLVVTLLDESERQRLAADVGPLEWTPGTTGSRPTHKPGTTQLDNQVALHRKALEPRNTDDELVENNYERGIRYLTECGFLNDRGRQVMVKAFEIDHASHQLLADAPGSGGFLIRFAVELQQTLDAGDAATERLNEDKNSVFGQSSDNGAFSEIVGSHSLVSKDTVTSTPFFDDTRVMASVASSSVLSIMLEQVSGPAGGHLAWTEVLHHLIRYPPAGGGWERRAISFFRQNDGRIPAFADLPELAQLVKSSQRQSPPVRPAGDRSKRTELEDLSSGSKANCRTIATPRAVDSGSLALVSNRTQIRPDFRREICLPIHDADH